ncbi:hypothetical protein [Rhizobacter sp. P5_C2]
MNLLRTRGVHVTLTALLLAPLLAVSACKRSELPAPASGGTAPAPTSAVTPPPGDSAASATGSGPAGGTAIGGMEAHPTEAKPGTSGTPAPTGGDGSASAPAAAASK